MPSPSNFRGNNASENSLNRLFWTLGYLTSVGVHFLPIMFELSLMFPDNDNKTTAKANIQMLLASLVTSMLLSAGILLSDSLSTYDQLIPRAPQGTLAYKITMAFNAIITSAMMTIWLNFILSIAMLSANLNYKSYRIAGIASLILSSAYVGYWLKSSTTSSSRLANSLLLAGPLSPTIPGSGIQLPRLAGNPQAPQQ